MTSNLKSMTQLTTHSYNNVNISTPNIRFVFIVFLITFINIHLALLITSNLKSMTQLTTHSYNNVNISTPNIRFVFIVFLITFINIHIILKTYMFSLLQCLSEHYFCL